MAKTPASTPSRSTPRASGKRIQVRRSGVHGKGVFALQDIAEGETVIEYVGEIISWKEALRRHPHDPQDPNHTFYFHLDDKHVIDALYGGNSSRWINHACEPNTFMRRTATRCEFYALRRIGRGEELTVDYGESHHEGRLRCRCGSMRCRRWI